MYEHRIVHVNGVSGSAFREMWAHGEYLSDIVYRHVGTMIVDGELPPGSRVHDKGLAEDLNVSRTPVREALQRLARIGLVEMVPHRFTRVTHVSVEEACNWQAFAGHQIAIIAREVASRMTEADRAHAAGLVRRMADTLGDPLRYSRAHSDLYHCLASASDNHLHNRLREETAFAVARALQTHPIAAARLDDAMEAHGLLESTLLTPVAEVTRR